MLKCTVTFWTTRSSLLQNSTGKGVSTRRGNKTLLESIIIYLFGLSFRLVLRALKLSFSGVSSKDRRTFERKPCRWRQGDNSLDGQDGQLKDCKSKGNATTTHSQL